MVDNTPDLKNFEIVSVRKEVSVNAEGQGYYTGRFHIIVKNKLNSICWSTLLPPEIIHGFNYAKLESSSPTDHGEDL